MVKRRDFLKGLAGGAGAAIAGFTLGSLSKGMGEAEAQESGFGSIKSMVETPTSDSYLLVDRAKCTGCRTCMLACSLVHEGKENLSLSRIQVTENPFANFPKDLIQNQCRQCQHPECVAACPTGAMHVDELNGNVRMVDPEKCIGCQRCIYACGALYEQARVHWNHEEEHAQKCDLCTGTPYWEENGGPDGKQACVEACPVDAIEFSSEVPLQIGSEGYKVNLRDQAWEKLGFSTDSKYSQPDSPYKQNSTF